MLGKSVGRTGRVTCASSLLLVGALALSRARTTSRRTRQTGPDGKIKGAKTLDARERRSEGERHRHLSRRRSRRLEADRAAREAAGHARHQAASGRRRARASSSRSTSSTSGTRRSSSSKKTGKKRSAAARPHRRSLENAKGKYFIRVYAVGRGDAGKYKLTVEFKETLVGPAFDPLKLEIPDPPKLAAVPEPSKPCDEFNVRREEPGVQARCARRPARRRAGRACKGKCPDPPDDRRSRRAGDDAVPQPARRARQGVQAERLVPPCPDMKNPDPNNPNCDSSRPIRSSGASIGREVQGGDVDHHDRRRHAIRASKTAGRASVLRGDSDKPLDGGDVTVIRVDKTRDDRQGQADHRSDQREPST